MRPLDPEPVDRSILFQRGIPPNRLFYAGLVGFGENFGLNAANYNAA
jgi:hypothetical protein